MAYLSKITLPSGNTYDIKDQGARDLIKELMNYTEYLGVTTTPLSDGSTTNPITINGESVTAVNGDVATYDSGEFIFNGTVWQKFGDLSGLGAFAYADTGSGSYTPVGTVSQPTFSGSSLTSTGNFTPSGTVSLTNSNSTVTVSAAATGDATYTPAGSVAAPTISVSSAGSTTTVNSITAVGTLPSCTLPTYTVENETLTITAGSFSAGTLPTKGSDTTVKTGDASYTASAPAFTGTGARLVTGNISIPSSANFSGTQGSVSVSGTPSGTVSQPSFSGTAATITISPSV